ncbi:hypothetical protein EAG_10923 [Camponotus floridanus]|uniref:Uncharacterized protein n=1 Tax=Camponotus floridanus TaxID=104421 RepID=E2ALQ7_CAMFO|nr:hypothetical protein EAG_10923 [Camponotus floridanus]
MDYRLERSGGSSSIRSPASDSNGGGGGGGGGEPVSAAGRAAKRGEDDGKKGRERRLRSWVIRLGYGGGPAASREDGYPLFESRNAPDEKCTRLKFTARKKGASDLEAYQIVIVGNRRLIYHGNASYPYLLSTVSPLGVFNYYHSHFCASRTMATSTSLFLETRGFAV